MNFELISCATDQEVAASASRQWLERLASIRVDNGPYCVALSGGRIATRFFSEIASQAKSWSVNFAQAHFFWADERCVPPDDPDSNYAIARETFFTPLKISDRQIHRIRGEIAPESAARDAEAEIRNFAPIIDGQPRLDLIFLGMGEDGHVASLFPGEAEEIARNPAVYRGVTAIKPPPRRITLGYPAIVAAVDVWVLASGPGKEGALRESLAPNGKTPLGRVIQQRTTTRIFTEIGLA